MANFSVIVNGDTSRLKKQIQTIAKTETVTVRVNAKGDSLKTVSKQVTTLDGQTKKITTSTERFGKSQQLLGTTTKTVTKDLQMAGVASDSLAGKFGTIIKKVATFGLATAVIGLFTTGVYEAGRAIKDFDDAVTDFKKVSDLSGDALDNYTKRLGEMGLGVARTRTEMTQASAEFKKSSFSDEDSAILSEIASKFQNVADSELSAGDSASFIISQMKAFNISATDAEKIIDSVNEVEICLRMAISVKR